MGYKSEQLDSRQRNKSFMEHSDLAIRKSRMLTASLVVVEGVE